MQRIFILIILILHFNSLAASDFVTERIKLKINKQEYNLGDSLDFEGFVTRSDSVATPLSRYVYVEIISQKDSILERHKITCDKNGKFQGRLPLRNAWTKNICYLRAYTKLMQNFSPYTFPTVSFGLECKMAKPEENPTTLNCSFYPEGGRIVTGNFAQNILVYMTDSNRKATANVKLKLVHQTDTLMTRITDAGGMALITLSDAEKENYKICAEKNGRSYEFNLPMPDPKALSIQLTVNRQRAFYQILGEAPTDSLSLYCFQEETGIQQIPIPQNRNGVLDLKGISTQGTISLFLINKDRNIISQRTASINLKENSDHMWQYDLLSPILFPTQAGLSAIQAWLLSGTFIRFDLQSVLSDKFHYTYPYEDVMLLQGTVTNKFGSPISQGVINAFNNSSFKAYQAELDKDGHFVIPVDDFDEMANEFFISAERGKKFKESGYFKYEMEDNIFPPVLIAHRDMKEQTYADAEVETIQNNSAFNFEGWNKLPEVIVKAKTVEDSHPDFQTKKFYEDNYISLYDKDGQFLDFKSVMDRMPFVNLERVKPMDPKQKTYGDGYVYRIMSTRGSSTLKPSTDNVKIKLDGYYITPEEAWYLDPNQLEDVEYLTPREAIREMAGGLYGLLKIRTRQPDARRKAEKQSMGIWYMPMGIYGLSKSGE